MTTEPLNTHVPSGTALLMVDFQDWILTAYAAEDGPAAAGRAEEIHRSFRAQGRHVIHVRHQVENGRPPTRGGRFDISAAVVVEADEWVITKTTISAFGVAELHDRLQAEQITTIVLAGVVTEAAVQQTALDALILGYHLVIPRTAVASSTAVLKQDTLRALAAAGCEIRCHQGAGCQPGWG